MSFKILAIILLVFTLSFAPCLSANSDPNQHLSSVAKPTQDNGTLSGYVHDTAMTPLENALIRVYFHDTYRENTSDATGYYHVTDIPICYCLKNATCSKIGYYPEWALLSITENTTHDFILTPANQSTPYGPSQGFTNITYTFNFLIPEIPGQDQLFAAWTWGDGTTSEWLGPFPGGQWISGNHSWTVPGKYDVRVKLKDNNGSITESDPWPIRIYHGPVFSIEKITGGLWKVGVTLKNTGDYNATNVSWEIYTNESAITPLFYDYGMIARLDVNKTASVHGFRAFVGFGPVSIILRLGWNERVDETIYNGFVFLTFIIIR